MKNKVHFTVERRSRCTRSLRFHGLIVFIWLFSAMPVRCGQAGQPPAATCVPEAPNIIVAGSSTNSMFKEAFTSPSTNPNSQTATRSLRPEGSQAAIESAAQARKSLERAAHRGDNRAQVNLAVASLAGWGAPPNAGAAVYWLHAAADRGYPLALYDLGILYMNGCGVHQDYIEAFRFFEKGARAGDPAAEVNLGYLYDQGLGVARDRSAAAFWYRKAAEAGIAAAQYNLADLYLRGEGVTQDDAAAFYWFQLAAVEGHARARAMLGSMYASGRGTSADVAAGYMWLLASELEGDPQCADLLKLIKAKLSPAQIAEAQERAKALGHPRSPSEQTALLR